MRDISANVIRDTVKRLSIDACINLPPDICSALCRARDCEVSEVGRDVLSDIRRNFELARDEAIPICQDTGMACVFVEIGQEVHITGGSLYDAINEGVRLGYSEGYLRKSVVRDPLCRTNTGDNTPALIYTDVVDGDGIRITVMPKGFGSENMSRIKMLKPSDGLCGVIDFIVETVSLAGANPCPPIIVGVGLGGSFDKAAYLAKRALLRPIDERSGNEYYARLEGELLEKINALGIGPAGLGGSTTALAVNIETMPTHIAGLPCAVNISCHATRHKSEVI